MTDTIAYGDILTNTLAVWLANPVTQQDKVDNPVTLPAPTAADAQTRSTAKVANTTANVHEKIVRWLNGLDAAGQAAVLARFLGGISLADAASITAGNGTPEGAITAPVGSLRLRLDGGAATTLYVKETGAGNTGWAAVGGGGGGGQPVVLTEVNMDGGLYETVGTNYLITAVSGAVNRYQFFWTGNTKFARLTDISGLANGTTVETWNNVTNNFTLNMNTFAGIPPDTYQFQNSAKSSSQFGFQATTARIIWMVSDDNAGGKTWRVQF